MHIDFAEHMLSDFPNAASYDSGNLLLTVQPPKVITGEVIEVCKLGFTEQECDITIDEIITGLANRAAFTEDDIAVIERIHANGGMSPSLLTGLIDYMRSEEHTGKLVVISESQGRYLYDNHEAFKPNK